MTTALVTGSGGLIGSEAAALRSDSAWTSSASTTTCAASFFGAEASTRWQCDELQRARASRLRARDVDIRDRRRSMRSFARGCRDIALVVHTAAQPSHDWAAREPHTDFGVNATGTLNLLEATRRTAPDAAFIFTSTNKVYGDTPNRLPLVEQETRWEIDPSHPYLARHSRGDVDRPDDCTASSARRKLAADVLVQEYGRYFGMKTACFRGGCLTGPEHAGAELHGFLAYLMKCAVTGRPYTVFGYKGKQVRDNIHVADLVAAFHVARASGPEVYNVGGGRRPIAPCSRLFRLTEQIVGRELVGPMPMPPGR